MRTTKTRSSTSPIATRGLVTRPLARVLLAMGVISLAAGSGSVETPETARDRGCATSDGRA